MDEDNEDGFSRATASYKSNPSLENYLSLRKEHPSEDIEVAVIGGMDQLLFMQDELERYGFDPTRIASAMDADQAALRSLSLQIMECIVEARKLSASGETHLIRRGLAVPDKLIDWLICVMLDAMSWNDNQFMPRELIVLIRDRLGGSNPHYEQASRAAQKRGNASMIAGQLKARGIKPTYKMIATSLGVAPSTVKRWFSEGEFEQETERWARCFDEDGRLKPLIGPK